MFLHCVTLKSVCSFAWLQFVPRELNEFYGAFVDLFFYFILNSCAGQQQIKQSYNQRKLTVKNNKTTVHSRKTS